MNILGSGEIEKEKYSIGILIIAVACLAYASNTEVFEEKLSLIETKTAKFLSWKEQIIVGYKNLLPEIWKTCGKKRQSHMLKTNDVV